MKIKTLSAAVAACVLASNAMAISIVTKPTPDLILTVSGATAVEKQFASYIQQTCTAGTLDSYDNPAGDAESYYCTVDSSITGTTTQDILFQKENGGSSTGVVPISQGFAAAGKVKVLDMTTCTDDDGAGPGTEWTCSDTTIDAQSEVGISDVEPDLFSLDLNIKPGAGGPVPAPLKVQPVNTQTFGIVVTPALRDALQTAQGLIPGSDEVSQMPSLSSAVIANIFAGKVDSWDSLQDATGTGIAAAVGQSDNSVNVCVRTPGSGTQAQFNAFYMKYGCAFRGGSDLSYAGFFTAQDPDATENNGFDKPTQAVPFPPFNLPLPSPYVFWNKGSSDMGKCLTEITADNRWAIGIQSLEKVDEGRTNRNDFKYLAIDGIAPTLENVAAGLYHNTASASIQWNTDVVTAGSVKDTLAQRFVDLAQDVSSVATFNASLQDDGAGSNDDRPVGGFRTPEILDGGSPANVGTLAFAQGSLSTQAAYNPANPVTPFNKGLVGPSSCAVSSMNDSVDVSQVGR